MKKIIDLRSDTVTKPNEAMRKAMYDAEVGDDVYKEDPTVNKLEEIAAEILGTEAALFVPTGLMGNQICLNVLTNPGDEVICERTSHIFQYESGSPAVLSGLQLNLIDGINGVFTPEQVEPLIRPESAYYMPRTRLIEVENTHNVAGGTINPVSNIAALQDLADKYQLFFHLDGARVWNAAVALGIEVKEITQYFDTVSCCLSKGLGAPIGSIIGSAKEVIQEAYRVRKAWGGGMRQVGVIAAAGIYALQNNIVRLAEDHINAKELAEFLNAFENVEIDLDNVETNIIMFKVKTITPETFIERCKEKGLLLGPGGVGVIRAVTHLDISNEDIKYSKNIFNEVLNES